MIPIRPDLYSAQPPLPNGIGALPPDPNVTGKNLLEGANISLRPTQITYAHIYNLRNQTWAIPRLNWTGDDVSTMDPIWVFVYAANKYPANSDSINPFIYANTSSDNNRDAERFNVQDCVANPIGSSLAPRGYFIIDAMDRGASRLAAMASLQAQYRNLSYPVWELPVDRTPGGPSVVAEYAGRVFYGGFSGEVIGEDKCSPKLSSYIFFSQIISDTSMVDACYQQADPTNKDDPDLVDTDGGFIRVEGAYGINGLVSLGSYLFIFAKNGVWKLGGGNSDGFTATSYSLTKLTNKGSSSPGSIVVVDSSILYWAQDAIYTISLNQFGDYVTDNITKDKIQNLYNSISSLDKEQAKGVYDSYQQKVSWLYSNRDTSDDTTKELILDLRTGAYTLFEISKLAGQKYPMVLEGILTEPFQLTSKTQDVLDVSDDVLVNTDEIVVDVTGQVSSVAEVKYLALLQVDSVAQIAFGAYKEPFHYDWKSVDGVGVDAPSYVLTGKISGGDAQRTKAVPYITFHFLKTEDGFTNPMYGVYEPTNQSSCIVQAQWDWTNSVVSHKWSPEFQAYRIQRHWTPSSLADTYSDGYTIVDSKSKIRGSGVALSLLLKSEPGKHLGVYGWSTVVEVADHV